MADTSNLTNYLTDVADSIREKTHSNELIPASKFDEKILSIATDTTANPTEILSGKTAYINGDKVTGTYPIQYKKLDDITSTNTTLDTPIEANMKLLPVGNTTQEVISAVAGTTVSGTDITISDYDDTKENKFIKLSGNTFQQTYEGYNYLPNRSTTITGTLNGIDYEINIDGTLKLQGTATAYTEIGYNKSHGFYLPAGNYKMVNLSNATFYFYSSTGNLNFYNNQVRTLNEAKTYEAAIFQIEYGTTVNIETKPMILGGTYASSQTIPDYEPYVGGKASPNLDYPQDIQVVKGSNNINIHSGNFLDNNFNFQGGKFGSNNLPSPLESATFIYENNTLKMEGNAWTGVHDSNYHEILSETQFTFCVTKNKNCYVRIVEYDENKAIITRQEGTLDKTFTTSSNTKYIRFSFELTSNTDDLTIKELRIVKGSTALPYVPHQEQNYPITLPTGMILAKIGNYRDYIYKNEDNWYKKEYVRHIQLPFSTLGNTSNPGWSNVPYIKNDYPDKNDPLKNMTTLKSNITIENSSSIRINTMSSNSTIFLYSASFGGLTGAQLKEKYPDLILDLYYGLAVPTDTQITDTTLIGQLEAIEEATGYAGTTYIITTNSNNLAIIPSYKYNFITPAPSPERESNIQVVKGSNNLKIQSKNYLDISKCVMGANNTTVDTTITYSTKTNRACTKFDVNPIYVKANTNYTIKKDTYYFSVAQINSNNIVINDSGWKSADYTFTTNTNCEKIVLNFKKSNEANFDIDDFKQQQIQIEEGSTASSFVPHQEQNYPITLPEGMELCKIGDYSDVIFKNEPSNPLYNSSLVENGWYKYSVIGKIILNGTETWTYQSQYPRFYTTNISEMFKTGGNAYSTHYIRDDTGSINNTFDFWADGTNRQCLIHDERFTTMADLNNWLSSNNVICYGRLRTPTYTQITDTTLINQLEAIYNNAKTYYDKTNIIITAAEENNATMQLKIKIPTQGIDTSEVTATSDDILIGKTAVINNQIVIGTSVAVVVSDTTALASDVAYGKVFYLADGTRAVGTYVPEDLNTELTALENQTTALQTALENKTSTEITQSEYEEAVEQVEDLLGDSNE